MSTSSITWREVLAWLTGGVGVLYLAGYLGLIGYCRAYHVVYFPALVDQQFLVLGAHVVATLLYCMFILSVVALILALPLRWFATRLAKRQSVARLRSRYGHRAGYAAVWFVWLTTFGVLVIVGQPAVHRSALFYLSACCAQNVAVLRWLWLRRAHPWLLGIASISVTCHALTLPIVYGMTLIGPCRIYAEVRHEGQVIGRGGLLSRGDHEVVLIGPNGTTDILSIEAAVSIHLEGWFNAATRARESCKEGNTRPSYCCL